MMNTEIHVLERSITVITAQQRDALEDNGFSFVHCKITGTTYVRGTYLGRAWGSSPTVVFAYTDMANVIHPERWNDFGHPERSNNMFYGEFQNSGLGSNVSGQARYTKKLSDAEAKSFLSLGYIQGSKWLLPHLNTRSRHSIV
ncbi:putative pectinesterase 63 [Prunus yedoensis var. nudiflora]|uniref:pectinesterase n=1 Tax=Prunus yedoensis var. nudiflora TaxID=2094558 RepID=A0A314Z1Z2_PRUYE|nr:putative pectinesterase 63 [Prunus yedoensis var. nudiflora]